MFTNYIKIAWKVLLRHPFYTFITLFGISLTLTVLMVLTSFIDHLVGSHYPEVNRDRSIYIQMMTQTDSLRSSRQTGSMSYRFLTQYAKTLKTPERVTVFSFFNSSNAYAGARKIKLNTSYTDADYWFVNQYDFLEGKPFNDQHISQGDRVAVITDDFKRQYFDNADEPVVGRDVEIESVHYKVIGVVKGSPITRAFTHADVYFPYTAPKSNYQNPGFRGGYMAIAMAKDKGDMSAIQEEFQDRMSRIPMPAVESGFKYSVLEVKSEPYVQNFLSILIDGGPGLKAVLFGVIGFVLFMLIGLPVINLINVNVSRILERASEIGIRKAFGAPIRTLLWQFIIENIFITFIGGAIAFVLSFAIIQLINNSGWIAYADLAINLNVFAVSVLVCLVFGFLSGVLPALRMSKLNIADALKA